MSDSGIFNRALMLQYRRRAFAKALPGADFLLARAAEDLGDRLDAVERHFAVAIDLAGHNGLGALALARSGKADKIICIERDQTFLHGAFPAIIGDEEALPLDARSADLIVSLLAFQSANDLPGVLIQIIRALKPDGLFLAAMAGGGTLGELRESLLQAEIELAGGGSPRVSPFADVRDAGALLQRAGFALPVTDVETVTVRYDSMFDLMRDLRAMGMQNALVDRSRRPATRQLFIRAAQIYAERFADADGRIRATFATIWMSGWAPHESQQKPLKRGSATSSLADALANAENKNDTGE